MRNIILGFALVFLPILLFLITNKFEIFMFWEYKPFSFIFDAVHGYISLVSIVCGLYYFSNKNFRLSSPVILLTAAYFSISILMSNLSGSAEKEYRCDNLIVVVERNDGGAFTKDSYIQLSVMKTFDVIFYKKTHINSFENIREFDVSIDSNGKLALHMVSYDNVSTTQELNFTCKDFSLINN